MPSSLLSGTSSINSLERFVFLPIVTSKVIESVSNMTSAVIQIPCTQLWMIEIARQKMQEPNALGQPPTHTLSMGYEAVHVAASRKSSLHIRAFYRCMRWRLHVAVSLNLER